MSPTLQRHYAVPDDDLVPAAPAPRTLVVGLNAKRPAAGLSLPVDVEHLRAPDLAAITRDSWLPPDHPDHDEHLRLIARVGDGERALSELEGELSQTVTHGQARTQLKIVVSPVRVRVSPSETALEIRAFFVAGTRSATRDEGISRPPSPFCHLFLEGG